MNRIPREWPDPFIPLDNVGGRDRSPLRRDRCKAACRLTREQSHQVENVRAEDPRIFTAAALRVLFATTAQFEHFTDLTRRDQLLDDSVRRRVMRLVRQRQLEMPHLARADHVIRLSQRRDERLLHVDVAAMLGRCESHLTVLVNPARSDRYDVQPFLVQHLAEVGVRDGSLRPLLSLTPPGLLLIGDRDDFTLRHVGPHRVQTVPVVPLPRAADDSHSQLVRHDGVPWCDWNSRAQ